MSPSIGRWATGDRGAWPCLEFSHALDRVAEAGEAVLRFAVWLAPEGQAPPSSFTQLADAAWRATWQTRQLVAGFNPGGTALRVELPEDFLVRTPQGWIGEEREPAVFESDGSLCVPAGACAIVETRW